MSVTKNTNIPDTGFVNPPSKILFNHPAHSSYDNYEEPSVLFSGFILRCGVALYVGTVFAALTIGFALTFYFGMRFLEYMTSLYLV